ncbi:serine/threonine-protein phosphatase 7 long form homolog [Gossypium arboreum]|uniref:serine/threonine-protein phosphatase 7 long form homolog n=1 Tax=Gossypium arboreum TaxID=29729 RepID=UPI0008196B4B|nr:serine/threonine-protein phosphatase 7 long form homolog [Gossypium arboreum]
MDSLIDSTNHISSSINEMVEYRALKGRIHSVGFQPNECLIPFLELAGFGSAALIWTFNLRYDLISALVERWRPETHTYHLSCGECTITLEDVALQLGLPIDGNAVTGVSLISRPARLCYDLFGRSPSEGKFQTLKFSWLKANFEYLPSTATKLEVMHAARAYIMHLIGGVLMLDTHGSEVHLMHLLLLSNLHNTRLYSWGSAVLAILYRELCQTTDPSAVDISGCLILLQSWALYRMPFLAFISHQSYIFPLVNRWSTNPGIGRSYTVLIYRLMIENHSGEGFIWMPYSVPEVTAIIPSYAHVHSHLWCISAPLIHFHTVEWYHGNRVLRQFSCIQYIPTQLVRLDVQLHGMNRRGRHGTDWGDEHSEYITMWNNRFSRVLQMDRCLDLQPSPQYLQWHYEKGKPFLFGGRSMVVPPHTTRIGQHLPNPHHAPALEVDPEPEPEPEPELHSESSSYPPSYSAPPEPYPSPFSSPPGPYPAPFSTPPGSSSSVAFESFSTPIHMDEENVDHRSHPQRERRAPRRYTPRTTPSNHHF